MNESKGGIGGAIIFAIGTLFGILIYALVSALSALIHRNSGDD